jgi:hypothetical protein
MNIGDFTSWNTIVKLAPGTALIALIAAYALLAIRAQRGRMVIDFLRKTAVDATASDRVRKEMIGSQENAPRESGVAKYDLAISFAGEQRSLARSLAERLDGAGYSIFFDEFHQAELWGRDLTVALRDVYSREARWCLVLVSKDYVQKAWTNFERQNALSRFMQERSGYLLCLRLDGTELPGLPSVIGYIDYTSTNEDNVYQLLLQKMGSPSHEDYIATVNKEDRKLAELVIRACYRRAIFTRMASEIDLAAMYDSIGEAIGRIQAAIPRMRDQRLQFVSLQIVRALDEIERVRTKSDARISVGLKPELQQLIDDQKQQVVRLLLEIRRAAALSIQLPMALRTDHFFGLREARGEPLKDDDY